MVDLEDLGPVIRKMKKAKETENELNGTHNLINFCSILF